jgi:hypothetical protein
VFVLLIAFILFYIPPFIPILPFGFFIVLRMKTELETEIEKNKVIKFLTDEQLNEAAVREVDEVSELVVLIEGLPVESRSGFYDVVNRIVDGMERRQQILTTLHDSLTQLNLDLKYLLFDLDATRRERDECLKLLNEW